MNRGFGSDNHSGVHPKILNAIYQANESHQPSYGTDPLSRECEQIFASLFGDASQTFFVFNGTAANVLALSVLAKSFEAVIAAEQAHILNDECGAPEKLLGCKLIGIKTPDAKLTPELIQPYLVRRGDQHYSQLRVISITQPTELGTVYSLDEIRVLGEFAKKENLYFHMDGARLVNAAASLNTSLKQMTTDCGVDAVSLGGTKNGLLFGEAIVFPQPTRLPDGVKSFKYIRKQLMQLPSKTRFIAAQFKEFLGTGLWRLNAEHANKMAQLLAEGLMTIKQIELTQKVQANAVFARIPKSWISTLRSCAFFYVWDESTFECRLMTTWDSSEQEISAFIDAARKLSNPPRGEAN